MERNALTIAMKTSISEVLETMFFLPLEFPDSERGDDLWGSEKSHGVMSKLSFSGPIEGYFVLFVPEDVALSITGNFLGTDEKSVSQEEIEGTVKEIINMIAGSTFCNYDDQAVFSLGIPVVVHESEVPRNGPNWEEGIFVAIHSLDKRLGLQMVMT
ncbi:MAG: chemotaxis protein CheX [Thermodesulfobacteriota bacterium]|nr:chemotaxis protein CheX [Thermodesulfobacteriota bacterium]